MSKYIEKLEKLKLTVVPMRGIVAFPSIPLSFEVPGEYLSAACENAHKSDEYIFIVTQKDISIENPVPSDLYNIGTVAKIKQFVKLPEGNLRIVTECICRAEIVSCLKDSETAVMTAEVMCRIINVDDNCGYKGEALILTVMNTLEEFISHLPKVSPELMLAIKSIKAIGLFSDFVAFNILIQYADKQKVLDEFDPMRRIEKLAVILESELLILRTESDIHQRVRRQIESGQKEYYLREQLKIIQNELGYSVDNDNEIDDYFTKIAVAHLPEEVSEKLVREVKKLNKNPYNSAESGVIRNYLDICLEIPWSRPTKDRIDVGAAKHILDKDHDGLEKVKERILEFIAVKQLNPQIKNQILCLVGPPGTGKTSIGKSIATAMKRKYVRVSLGGVRDEADIRGHRKTYIGSMPGRIINGLVQAGSSNPVMLLDEIDKLTRDSHGDPSSALLEVLDSEQNKAFRDHFIELPVDLGECLFIATANTLETVPRPLIDRMEIIELKIYTRHEKLSIAKNHLIPKQIKRHGLSKRILKITDDAIFEMIDFYTAEAGVRNLEREIGSLCRKIAKEKVEKDIKSFTVTAENLSKYLGVRKILPDKISDSDEIGVVNGLAYTELGGDILKIEAAVMEGTGKIELTGSLGDVMKESAYAAVTYIRSHAVELGIEANFYKNRDIHIHVPEGAVPKDGPSAGIAITIALISELTGNPIKRDIAMTGEITLRGRVLPIGGLKEKTMAAYKAGIKTVFIPAENVRDLNEIDNIARASLEFIPCKTAEDIISKAFTELKQNMDLKIDLQKYHSNEDKNINNMEDILPSAVTVGIPVITTLPTV